MQTIATCNYMDKSKIYIEQKKKKTKEYILCTSSHMKLNRNKTNL